MITVRNLYKEYQITKKGKGLGGTLKALFRNEKQIIHAVNGLDFHVSAGERLGKKYYDKNDDRNPYANIR